MENSQPLLAFSANYHFPEAFIGPIEENTKRSTPGTESQRIIKDPQEQHAAVIHAQ